MNRTRPVVIAGAGIGGAKYLTPAVDAALRAADVIVYDRLLDAAILDRYPAAEKIYAGKSPDRHTLRQEEINALLVKCYRSRKNTVRLKGGDPFVFGRGGEEALHLASEGIPFRVLSGLTAGVVVPAQFGIPVTHRNIATSVSFITGHRADENDDFSIYAEIPGTLIFYMGLSNVQKIASDLCAAGKDPDTPLAVLSKGMTAEAARFTSTLGAVAKDGIPDSLATPALIAVGDTIALADAIDPTRILLLGRKNIVLTGDRVRAEMADILTAFGANVVERPTIAIEPIHQEHLAADISAFDAEVLVFTSANAVSIFFDAFRKARDIRDLYGVAVYAVGEKTAEAVSRFGIRPEAYPAVYNGDAFGAFLRARLKKGTRIYFPHSLHSRPDLRATLEEIGRCKSRAVYRPALPERALPLPDSIDAIAFSSGSTVAHFVALYSRKPLLDAKIFSIGPMTTERLLAEGVDSARIIEANCATAHSLAESILDAFESEHQGDWKPKEDPHD